MIEQSTKVYLHLQLM